jgi:hypothetical protein
MEGFAMPGGDLFSLFVRFAGKHRQPNMKRRDVWTDAGCPRQAKVVGFPSLLVLAWSLSLKGLLPVLVYNILQDKSFLSRFCQY